MTDQRPNILIFMTDQQQADVVAPDHPCHTPNAQRLASEGIRFTEAYCPTAHCCPSRATFMSGLYPSRHGVYNNVSNPTAIHRGLADGVTLFSERLRAAGYNLAYSGKWHVTDEENPADRGWEELRVTAGKGSFMHRAREQWREYHAGEEPAGRRHGQVKRPGWADFQLYDTYENQGDRGYENHGDYLVVQDAVAALPRLANRGQPWCLYVGPHGPHDPFRAPRRLVEQYDPDEIELPPSYADDLTDKPRIYQRMRNQFWDQLSEREVRESIAHYWAYCTMEDELLGDVLAALENTGQSANTLLLFVSDHGDYVGAHGLYCKGVPCFREAYNVPAIVRWPDGIQSPGQEVDAFVSLADFAPTFLEVAGIAETGWLSGSSLVPFFRGQMPAEWREAIHTQFNGVELYYTQRSVKTRQFKYVYNGFDLDELYDLGADPHEMRNLSERPEFADVKRDLVRRMWQFADEQEDDVIFNPYATVALAPWGPGGMLA